MLKNILGGILIKTYDKAKYKRKFFRYKTCFAIFFFVMIISFISGVVFSNIPSESKYPSEILRWAEGFEKSFRLSVLFDLSCLVLIFLSGPTIYAPVTSLTALIFYGITLFSKSWVGIEDEGIIRLFFNASSAYVFCIYSAFVTLTGIGIFSETKECDDSSLFDGVMFRAKRFRGIFNMRFVSSYILFFIFFAVILIVISALKCFLASLV